MAVEITMQNLYRSNDRALSFHWEHQGHNHVVPLKSQRQNENTERDTWR